MAILQMNPMRKLLLFIFNKFFKIYQIIWYISKQTIWPYSGLEDYLFLFSPKDLFFTAFLDPSWMSIVSSHPQLLFISFNDRLLAFCWGLKGIQLQSIRSVATTPKMICPTRTPTTSIDVSDSCPIEGSYNFFYLAFIKYRNSLGTP